MYLTIGFGFDSPGEGVVGCELRLLALAIGRFLSRRLPRCRLKRHYDAMLIEFDCSACVAPVVGMDTKTVVRFSEERSSRCPASWRTRIYLRPKTSLSNAVVCAAGFLRIFFSSSPNM